jgi:hypothetical protein
LTRLVEAHHSVLLGADGHGGDIVEAAGTLDCRLQGRPPPLWVDLGAVGVRSVRGPDDLTCVRIANDHLAGLRRGVDAGDKGHPCEATR